MILSIAYLHGGSDKTYIEENGKAELGIDKQKNTNDDNTAKQTEELVVFPEKNEPETEENDIAEGKMNCTLSVRCDTILNNMEKLDEEKKMLVPKDGVIYPEQSVTFYEGEDVFLLLKRELIQNNIHLEFATTPLYNSAYIEGIANLYEFDCGELSGWMYKVNGEFPNCGCSSYILSDGDRVEWVYTCDLGNDVGGGNNKEGEDEVDE